MCSLLKRTLRRTLTNRLIAVYRILTKGDDLLFCYNKMMPIDQWSIEVNYMKSALIITDVMLYFCTLSIINSPPQTRQIRNHAKVWLREC